MSDDRPSFEWYHRLINADLFVGVGNEMTYSTTDQFPALRITRDRFLRYLHFSDNTALVAPGEDGYERLGKIRPVIALINECLQAVYNSQGSTAA